MVSFQNCAPMSKSQETASTIPLSSGLSTLDREMFLADSYFCRIKSGEVFCSGNNDYGQLGDGTTTSSLTPVKVSGISDAVQVFPGFRDCGGCALLRNKSVKCWGAYSYAAATTIQNALNLQANVAAVAIEWLSSAYYVLYTDGTVYSMVNSANTDVTNATQLAAGGDLVCALINNGSVRCFDGQAGLGFPSSGGAFGGLASSAVTGFESGVTMIGVGFSNLCGLFSDGKVKCIGYNNSGQLGNGTMTNSPTLVEVQGISRTPVGLAMTDHSACVLLDNGEVECWGSALESTWQLGAGSQTSAFKIPGISGAVKLYVGRTDAGFCALLSNGTRKCWSSYTLPLVTDFNSTGAAGLSLLDY